MPTRPRTPLLFPFLEPRRLPGPLPRGAFRPSPPPRPRKEWIARILRALDLLEPAVLERDRWWYFRARTWCDRLSSAHGVPVDRVVAVLAVLSPSCLWERNLSDTRNLVTWWAGGRKGRRPSCQTYGRNVKKALGILRAPADACLERLISPRRPTGAPKTLSFYRMILSPWRRDVVVVDRHASTVALGSRPNGGRISFRRYRDIMGAYQRAGLRRGLSGAEAQACCWEAWRSGLLEDLE